MKQTIKLISISLFFIFLLSPIYAQSAEDIYKNAMPFTSSQNLTMIFKMTIHDESGEKTRELQIQSVKKMDTEKTLAKITSPSSLSGLKFLRIANNAQAIQTWLKTSRGVRRLAESMNSNEKLFNSDFSVDDLSQGSITNHVIERLSDKENNENLVIKDTDENQSLKIVTIQKETNIIIKTEYYNKNGICIKDYQVEEWGKLNNLTYPKLIRMTDKEKKSWTLLEVIKIDTKTQIPDSVFNASSL